MPNKSRTSELYNPVKIPEIVIEKLKDYEPCYIKVWAPEPDNDKSGKAEG